MESLDKHFSADDKELLKDAFIGNEADTDEYGEAWPQKGLDYLAGMGPEAWNGGESESIMAAILEWVTAWNAEGRGRYAGADASRTLLGFIFEDAWEQGRLPYYDDLGEIRSYLTDLKSD